MAIRGENEGNIRLGKIRETAVYSTAVVRFAEMTFGVPNPLIM